MISENQDLYDFLKKWRDSNEVPSRKEMQFLHQVVKNSLAFVERAVAQTNPLTTQEEWRLLCEMAMDSVEYSDITAQAVQAKTARITAFSKAKGVS